jgi:glycosyltransferase involved in cell wall biosynthesis
MTTPRVTVCIPTYNRARFLPETIRSVLDQTFMDFELAISDDASSDNTAEVVASFHDSRIRYYRHSTNIGLTPNWQFAFSMANTGLVAALADDDVYLPDHLATAIEALTQFPQATYYSCPAARFGNGATGEFRPVAITDTSTPLIYFAPKQAVQFLGLDMPGILNTMVCHREALNQVYWGRADHIASDLLILTQLMVRGGFVFGNRATERYRMHTTNASSVNGNVIRTARMNCMISYGVRYLTRFLLDRGICTLDEVESHGLHSPSHHHVVHLVSALAAVESPPGFRAVAKSVFQTRTDIDALSARFRLARRMGFITFPMLHRLDQVLCGWQP